ncbi:ABC transporter substrate-binding protein [Promineifilum sp.]|uniref:ABC transporter substrate-binding protein n=1 Tax=Promineifilum sp. TaxID=2664178 RepID=UPI0035B011E4
MFTKNRIGLVLAALLVMGLALVACQPTSQVVEVTRVVTETVTEEGQTVEVTRVVTEVEEVVVTPTAEPVEEVAMVAPDPTTYVVQTFGDMDTLDPALGYDTASNGTMMNIYETLIWYNGSDPVNYVPLLAEEVPSVENGGISEDGLTYTFNIREGITFHDGATLEASDVAYSWTRGMLQSDPNGPQWLLLEPIMGYVSGDVTEGIQEGAFAGDPEGLKAGATPEELVATCEAVKSHFVADDEAGTFTVTLAQPWGPFLATIAQTWGSVIDYDWAVAQGDWDGDCATWQDFYAPGAENTKLGAVTNGTGPYMLDHWTPGEEYVLAANPNYWRASLDEPLWEGGPSGAPQIQTVITRLVDEWGTRFAALQAGDAASIALGSIADRPQVDPLVGEICTPDGTCAPNPDNPEGFLRKWDDLPNPSRTDAFLTWNIAEDSPYIGSGQLDGNGIPANFFSDINVRKAMATCFDYETYIQEAMLGEGVRNNGPIILDMLGYNPDGPMYEYNPEECAAYLEQAWDGALPETGFRFQIAFNTGNTARQTIGEIWQGELGALNELYQVETIGLPWPTLLRSFRASQLPVAVSGWVEDIHDPHNWVQPYTYGTFGGRQGLPEDIIAKYQEIASTAAAETDPAAREQMYFEIQQMFYDDAVSVILAQATGVRYEQRWVNGYFYNPITPGTYYYALSLAGE